jgi:hypothetical protein
LVENLSAAASELSLGVLIVSEYSPKRWIMLPFLLPLRIAVYRSSSTLERLQRETAAALRDSRCHSPAEYPSVATGGRLRLHRASGGVLGVSDRQDGVRVLSG